MFKLSGLLFVCNLVFPEHGKDFVSIRNWVMGFKKTCGISIRAASDSYNSSRMLELGEVISFPVDLSL